MEHGEMEKSVWKSEWYIWNRLPPVSKITVLSRGMEFTFTFFFMKGRKIMVRDRTQKAVAATSTE